MADKIDPPFTAEYAKSSRSACKVCKESICKDDLRLGVMVKGAHGPQANWHHQKCFWTKAKVNAEDQIGGMKDLNSEDQEEIRKFLKATVDDVVAVDINEFSVEYAKSGRASCKSCGEKIDKDAVRFSKLAHESRAGKEPIQIWYHSKCFVDHRIELGFADTVDKIPGFASIKEDDRDALKSKLKAMKRRSETLAGMENGAANADEPETKKRKSDVTSSGDGDTAAKESKEDTPTENGTATKNSKEKSTSENGSSSAAAGDDSTKEQPAANPTDAANGTTAKSDKKDADKGEVKEKAETK